MAYRRQPLLRRCRRVVAGLLFGPGGDVQRLHHGDRRDAVVLAPGHEVGDRPAVGPAGVRVADLRGEEFQKPYAGALAGGGDQRGQGMRARRQ